MGTAKTPETGGGAAGAGVRISVIIPCKDGGDLVREAVASAVEQEVAVPFEVVVVDDGSSEPATLGALEEVGEWEGVRVVENDRSPGVAGARNSGIRRARGDWIALLDADDVLLPGSLQVRWEVVRDDPGARFVAGNFVMRKLDGTEQTWLEDLQSNPRFREEPAAGAVERLRAAARGGEPYVRFDEPGALLADYQLAWVGAALLEKALLDSVGGFDERVGPGQDTNLWIRLGVRSPFHFVLRPLALYQRRRGSVTLDETPAELESRRAIRLLFEDPALRPHFPALRGRLARRNERLMWHYRERGRRLPALAASLRVIRWTPTRSRAWKNVVGTLLGRD